MKIIRYQSEEQAENLQARLHTRLNGKKKEFGYYATRYADPIQHPIDGDWGIILDDVRHPLVYADILEELTQGEINNIEDYSDEWKPDIRRP
jgi:hypothetical protein